MKDADKAELTQFTQERYCPFEGTDTCDECQKRGIQCPNMKIGEEGNCGPYELNYER